MRRGNAHRYGSDVFDWRRRIASAGERSHGKQHASGYMGNCGARRGDRLPRTSKMESISNHGVFLG
jgi:hypothetical protein